MSRAFIFAEWLLEILKLHFLWIGYTFRGLVVAGLFPATAAVYAVVRHWQLKREARPTAVLFKQYYKENFKTSNALGWMFFVITGIIVVNFLYIPNYPEKMRLVMYGVIFFFAFLLAIAWIYVFPVIVHYDLSIPELFTVTLRSGFISLSGLIMQLLFAGIIVMLIYKLPALFVLFGVVPLSLVQVAVSINVFDKLK